MFIVSNIANNRCTGSGVRPQILCSPTTVSRDNSISGRKNCLGGTVILLQHDRAGIWVIALEFLDIANCRSAECVNGLVGITNYTELSRWQVSGTRAHQLLNKYILSVIGILIFVNKNLSEPEPVVLRNVWEKLQ